jgi:hypothetical protein
LGTGLRLLEDLACTSLLLLFVGSPARLFSARLFYSPNVSLLKNGPAQAKKSPPNHWCPWLCDMFVL